MKNRLSVAVLFLAVLFSLISLPAAANDAAAAVTDPDCDWLVVPHERAGAIKKDWSVNDLINYYGSGALTHGKLWVYGMNPQAYLMTKVKAGSGEAVHVIWSDVDRSSIAWVEIYPAADGAASKWKVADGYYAGMALGDAEKLAGRSVPFSGFFNSMAGFIPFADCGGLYSPADGIQIRIGFTDITAGRKLTGSRVRWSASREIAPYKDKLIVACIGVAMNKDPQLIRD